MNQIITIGDGVGPYKYQVPIKEPADEKEIINHEYSNKQDQFWRTPVIKPVKYMTPRERIEYIERERQRWEEGVFVLINGELLYFTGMFYDHLTYMTFKSGKAEYFDHQRYDFYFRDLVIRDVKCRGSVFMKPRRYGATMEEQTASTYMLNRDVANNVALQSDTPKKVMSTLVTPIIQSYAQRPKFMRSDFYKPNGKMLISELKLSSNMAPDEDGHTKGDYLLGWCRSFSSLPRAMDGEEVAYSVMSEIWKWQTASPKEVLESNIKVLMGRKRAGKVSLESTMGDSDDYMRSVLDGVDIIARSNPSIRNENGYTFSGLYPWFVSALYSFDIPPDVFESDKFGKVNTDKHYHYLMNQRKGLDPKSKSYIFEARRMPLQIQDALMSANLNSYFRKMVLASRLQVLQQTRWDEKPYVRGNLIEDLKTGEIEFEYNPEGIWLWVVQPYFSIEKNIDTRNRFRRSDGVFYPPINPEGAIGYDPINYDKSQTTSSSLSRAAIFIHKKFDYFNKPGDEHYVSDSPMALCLWRPDDPREANKECIKACKFTGYPAMHEKSVNHVYEDFRDGGMLPFLLKGPDGTYGISQSNMTAKKDGLAMLQTRYAAPKKADDIDQLQTYPFEDGLLDLDNFDIGNTTPFDVTMSEIMKEHGLKQIVYTNQVDQSGMDFISLLHEMMPPR